MYQKLIVVGNLGNDPELRYMSDGTAVTNFSLATNRSWTDSASGEKVQETIWFRVSVWGAQAETVNQYLAKGRQVLVEGRLRPDPQSGGPRIWQRQDGTAAASFEVTAESVRFLSSASTDEDRQTAPAGATTNRRQVEPEEDDIPF